MPFIYPLRGDGFNLEALTRKIRIDCLANGRRIFQRTLIGERIAAGPNHLSMIFCLRAGFWRGPLAVLTDRRAALPTLSGPILIEVTLDTARHHEQAEAFDLLIPNDVSIRLRYSRIDHSFGDF